MPDLNYKITTDADLTGSEKTGESLDKLNQTAGEAKKGLAAAGEATEGLNVKGRELYRIAGMVDRIVPGAGAAIRAFGKRNDETALAVTGVAAVLEIVITLYRKVQEGAKAADGALATLLSEEGSKGAIEAMHKAWEDADIASTVYHHNLFRDEDDAVKRIADTNIEIAKRFQSAQEQIDKAQKGVAEASIDALEKQGVISHEEALKRKYELDVEYENKRLALMRQTDARILEIQRGELATKIGQKGAADSNEAEADAANKIAKGNLAKHEQFTKTYAGNISKAQDAAKQTGITPEMVQNLNELFENYTKGNSVTTSLADQYEALLKHEQTHPIDTARINLGGLGTLAFHGGEAGLAAYQGSHQDLKSNQGLLDAENKKDEALRTAAEIAKSDLDETKRIQNELKKEINDLTIKVGELAATNKANETNAATVAGLNKQAEAIKAGVAPPVNTDVQPPPAASTQPPFLPAGTSAAPGRVPFEQTDEGKARFDFGLVQQYADHIAGGGKLDNGQQQIFQTIANAMEGHAASQKELAALVDQLHSALVTDRNAINQKFANLISAIEKQSVATARAQNSADR